MIWYLLSDLDRNDWRGNRVTQFSATRQTKAD